MKSNLFYLIIFASVFNITACGGGGDDGNTSDTNPPVITITGNNPVKLKIGDSYTDAGATATDDIDGTVSVSVSGAVDVRTVGKYILTYTAKDSAGNQATAKRVVKIADSIQMRIDTGATVDINSVETYLESLESGLDLNVSLSNGKATWRRTYRELVPKIDLCESSGTKEGYRDDSVKGLEVEFSISSKGVFQANTIGDDTSSHLVVLATNPAWGHGADMFESNRKDFYNNYLSWSEFGEPADGYISDIKNGNRLSGWLQVIYRSLYKGGIVSDGPDNEAEFFKRPHTLVNGFTPPISIVRSYLRHQQMDFSWYPEKERPFDQFYNEKWSPIANVPNQNASLGRDFDLAYNNVTGGLMTLHTFTDNRNTGSVNVRGLSGIEPFSFSTSRLNISCTSNSCSLSNRDCSGTLLHLTDAYPTSIEMDARSVWSWIGTAAEVAVFGDVTTSNHSESPSPGDDGNPAPLRFVIPSSFQ